MQQTNYDSDIDINKNGHCLMHYPHLAFIDKL